MTSAEIAEYQALDVLGYLPDPPRETARMMAHIANTSGFAKRAYKPSEFLVRFAPDPDDVQSPEDGIAAMGGIARLFKQG